MVGPDLGPNCLQRLLADNNIINYQIRRIRTYGESGVISKEIKERNEIEERIDIVERNMYEACIGGTKYPISLEENRQISLINGQISP